MTGSPPYRIRVIEVALACILIAGMLFLPPAAFSQEGEQQIEDTLKQHQEALEKYQEHLEEHNQEVKKKIVVRPPKPSMPPMFGAQEEEYFKSTPRFGLYLEDLDFEDVYEMHYAHNYGVLISRVVRGGSADRAGLRKGDIIMEFDGEKVRFEDHLLRMRDSKHIGDTVQIKFFRDEKEMTTSLTFYPAEELAEEAAAEIAGKKKKKLSPGYGGGGFEPVWIDWDVSALNNYLSLNGFDGVPEGGIVAWGGGGQGNVGKGWFIGGMGAGFEKTEQVKIGNITKKYVLGSGFGGVTITKKLPIMTKGIVLDLGIMLGGGSTSLEVSETEGDFSWDISVDSTLNRGLEFKKDYFAYRPSLGLLIRIKNWVGVHGSVGYLGTYASDDKWTEQPFDFAVQGPSPVVPSGLSYSLGFWFGY